jgi:hypothetical protein
MNTPDRQPKLIHVRRPLKRIEVNFEPTVPLEGPITDGPLIRVGHPLKRARLAFEPVAIMHLRRLLTNGADADTLTHRLYSLAAKVNEMEVIEGRLGVRIDEASSGAQAGEVVLVLVPNDPADALETCKRIANILFNASPGVTVKVFVADQPDTPVYELAV